MDRIDEIFDLLERPDKWFLGGGRAVLWAPEFPRFLDVPGFIDSPTWYHHPLGPMFTVTLVAEDGSALVPKLVSRRWRVSHLITTYELGADLAMVERRSLSPEDVLVTELEIKSTTLAERRVDLIAWAAQAAGKNEPGADFITAIRPRRDAILIARQLNDAKGEPLMTYSLALGSFREADTHAVNLAEDGADCPPRWECTPFHEKFNEKGLPHESTVKGGAKDDLAGTTVYAALHYRLVVPPGTVRKFSVGMAVSKAQAEASRNLRQALSVHSPADRATRTWRQFFQSVPYLRSSDPYVERAYWYRWYGLRLNMVLPADYGPANPCVFEGAAVGRPRHAVSYSAPSNVRDLRWCQDKSAAVGTMMNFFAAQHPNGMLPGALGVEYGPAGAKGMYHADWGRALRELYATHPDKEVLRASYEPLVKYARWLEKVRDKEKSGLYDIVTPLESGQEHSPRYAFVEPEADTLKEFETALKGVDATVFAYELFRTLSWAADVLGDKRDARKWRHDAETTAQAVRARMFDPAKKMFVDVMPVSHERSSVKAAVGFYPFATDIVAREHLDALHRNLFDPKIFWTDFPVPSISMDDPAFTPTGEWKAVRMRCPSNGRALQMASCQVVEALCESAVRLDGSLRERAGEMLRNYLREMFIDGDPARPTSYEYYNPLNGKAPLWRANDDTLHGFLADLILRFVAGIRPDADGNLVIDPLPLGVLNLSVSNLKIRGKEISLDLIGLRGRVVVAGQSTRFDLGKPLTIPLVAKTSH